MAAKRKRRRTTSRKRKRSPAPRRRTVVVMNPKRRAPRRRPARKKPARRRRRAPRKNPSTTFLGGLWASTKGAGGGGLVYGLGYGTDYLPISGGWQSAAFFGTGFVTSILSSWLIDREFGAGMAGGTLYGTIDRARALMALRKLDGGAKAGVGADAGGVQYKKVDGNWLKRSRNDAGRIVVQRLTREAGAVIEARMIGRAKALRNLNQLDMPRSSLKTQGAASAFAKTTSRRYGPHNWLSQLERPRMYKEAGRVIRVVSAYNR